MTIEYVTLDSSFLISFLSEDESRFRVSKKFMDYASHNRMIFLIPMIVLIEVFHTLKRTGKFEDDNELSKFESFFNSDSFKYFDLNMNFFNMFKEFPFFNKLKTSDAIIAASALINKSILVSWDKHLLQNAWLGYPPDEFLQRFN